MIPAQLEGLRAALTRGSVAYVDREWLEATAEEVPALVVASDGTIAWGRGRAVPMPAHVDSDTAAALALLVVAEAALAALGGLSSDEVEVTGSGVIALQVRERLAGRSSATRRQTPAERPAAIVDTTGDPGVIADATRRTADLGTVVLAGEILARRTELNLYPDVHMRGLTLAGVPPPLHDASAAFAETSLDDPLLAASRDRLVDANASEPLSAGAAWYRVSG